MQHHTTREEAMMITPTSTISPPDSPEDLHKKSRAPNPFSIDHILERDFSPPLPMGLQSPPLNSNSNHHHLQNHHNNNNNNNNNHNNNNINNNNNSASSANMAAAAAAAAARLQSHMFHQSMMNQSSAAAMAAAAAAAGYQNPYAGHHHLGPQFAHLSAGLHRLLHLHPYRKPKRIRTAFSPGQLMELEKAFDKNHYVVGTERKQLAQRLNLTETQVKVWFQNRRTKHKRQKSDD